MLASNIRRPPILASIMAASFMVAIESTIVSTAMPQIVAQLGQFGLYSWVFSAYLLAQTATIVVFGKLADSHGRRPVVLIGLAIFLAGSILCGFAWSMPSLIAFRLIQGLGAGAVQPVTLTLVGDLYPGAERGKVQGYLASVWGVSSVIGPLAGGLIIQHLHWGWIFWINIPVGLAALAGFFLFLHETVQREQRSVDVFGAALFTVAIAALMLVLTEASIARPAALLLQASICAIGTVLFILRERTVPDPMIAVGLWARRLIATLNALTLVSGMTLIGLSTFLPMYVQAVMGRSPITAGFTLTAMVLGWPISATLAARNFHRFGLRPTLLAGAVLLPLGASFFVFLTPATSPLVAGLGSLVVGFGMGLLSTAAIVLIQGSVDWSERGSATASNIFARNLGSTLGAAAFGGVLNLSFGHRRGAITQDSIRGLINGHTASPLTSATSQALNNGLHTTFWMVMLSAAVALPLAMMIERDPQPAAALSG